MPAWVHPARTLGLAYRPADRCWPGTCIAKESEVEMWLADKMVAFWRNKVRGPVLRTYDTSVEELGGVPWRAQGDTERWFLPAIPERRSDSSATVDSSAFVIAKPSLVTRLRDSPKMALASGGFVSLLVLLLAIRLLSTSATAEAAPVAAPLPSAAPVAALPAPAPLPSAVIEQPAPQVAPVPQPGASRAPTARGLKHPMSPSVKALFDGGDSPGKAAPKARPAKRAKKGRRR